MGRLLPTSIGRSSAAEARPRVIGIDGDEADDLLAAMSSTTARNLLAVLHDEPAAPSELANEVDTSLQNVQYHLGKLEDAGAVEVVDTVYSEKGREMKLYAPADQPLVVVAGGSSETASLRSAIATLLSGVGIVGLLAILIQSVLATPESQAEGGAVMMEAERATPVAGGGGFELLGALAEPGVLFFLGGTAALLVTAAVWYVRH